MNIKISVAVACFHPGRAKGLSAPLYSVFPSDTKTGRLSHFVIFDNAMLYPHLQGSEIPRQTNPNLKLMSKSN